MTLIKSISGIRGTIGGKIGDNLTPLDIVKFTSAYGTFIKQNKSIGSKYKIVVGRDARISGKMVNSIVVSTLNGLGIDVVDLNLATTPTVEIAVVEENADGGIILTASHNPKQWNALKLLNYKGEFISANEGEELLKIAESGEFDFCDVDSIGNHFMNDLYDDIHINKILELKLVDVDAITKADFTIAIDAVNSVGGIILPKLLGKLGVEKIICLYCEPNGVFPHNPEPLPENLTEISQLVKNTNADLGFVVDPDVDRLAIINEDGTMFGEEYTLVSVADYILSNVKGSTVSNLSSTQALKDISDNHKCKYYSSAVGEVNVVRMMKDVNAVIGGEGNGGIIYPELHYGRDALVGIALFLSHLAKSKLKCSELRDQYPEYFISKNKIELAHNVDIDNIFEKIKSKYSSNDQSTVDGLKIIFQNEWVHLRRSNTEPIIRIYAESKNKNDADNLSASFIGMINSLL